MNAGIGSCAFVHNQNEAFPSASTPAGQQDAVEAKKPASPPAGTAYEVHALDAMPSSPAPSPVIDISDTESGDDAAAASGALSRSAAERIASTLTTQAAVDALCRNYGLPTEFAARTAGKLRACGAPPRGSVCVYAHMLETGVRFPLHDFFCEALAHFRLAPGQLSINGWRVLVGFVALCHEAGVRPSMALLRHFFQLYNRHDWYYFRCRADAGVLFIGTSYSQSEKEWKGGFFFLTSPESWRCPVRWGKPPYKSSAAGPVLTSQQKQSAEKLLGVHGAPQDLRAYLRKTDLAAALSGNLAGAPSSPTRPSPRSTVPEVVDPPVRDMTDSMPVEKTAAPAAETEQVKSEPQGNTIPMSGKKRRREEVTATDGLGCAAPVSDPCPPPRFGLRSPHSPVPDTHDGDSADWKAARKVLEGIVTPSRERQFTASKPSDVVASSYVAVLQAANYATFSVTYALDLEEKVLARERGNLALWEQVEKEKAARLAAEAELEKAKAELESVETTAVQQFLGSEEYTRRLDEHALTRYLRGAEEMKRVALRHYPHLDAAKLELPV